MTKTGNFEQDVNNGYYRWERDRFMLTSNESYVPTFDADLRAWLSSQGVPPQYVAKVASFVYDRGHSGGEEEIMNCAYGVIEIFQ